MAQEFKDVHDHQDGPPGPAFGWISTLDPATQDMIYMVMGAVACLIIGVPMVIMRHRAALAAAKRKMD